jgi:hypothetical protein
VGASARDCDGIWSVGGGFGSKFCAKADVRTHFRNGARQMEYEQK